MKIIVTGASGYVGHNIIPLLKNKGADILLVGRDPAKLREMFPDMLVCRLEDMPKQGQVYDRLIHLAVLNNNAQGDLTAFQAVNVDLTLKLATQAAQAGVREFYNISSVHVLDDANRSFYAQTKRRAVEGLKAVSGITVVNIYLPFVRGAEWNGKLAFLNRLPNVLAKPLEYSLLAAKPSVKAATLAHACLAPVTDDADLILSEGQSGNGVYRFIKRALDLLFAIMVIGLLWWALLIIWGLIKYGSAGPGIFAQERVGREGKIFTCYKFRTMQQGTVQAGTHEVSEASVTPIGRVLRRTKLDELPQVLNILKNEISLIGPRPGLPVQKELFAERQNRSIFAIKPGISGLAQINNIDMSDPKKLAKWDAKYIALQSLLLDIKIALKTARGGGQGDKISKE